MTRESTQDELRRLVDREVYYCVSALVNTLAEGYGGRIEDHGLSGLACLASDLVAPRPDYEACEYWIVSDWLADNLHMHGEKVSWHFAGLTVWARMTTGQAIYMDGVIEDIWREIHREDA